MPPKALITGATGFIGSHLVNALAALNWEVTCLTRPSSRTDFLATLPVHIKKGPMEDMLFLENAVKGQEYVFHLAARIHSAPKVVYEKANFFLTKDLLTACLHRNPEIKRFVYVSSISAAGPSLPGRPSDERQAPAPTSEYGRSKLKGEEAVRSVWHRIPSTIIRPPNVYGPRQQETELLIQLIGKRIVPVLKRVTKATSLIYVEDLVEGICQAALSEKTLQSTYYLTDGHAYSWREAIFMIKRLVHGSGFFFPVPEDVIIISAWLSDILRSTGIVNPYFGRKIWRAMVQTSWVFSPAKAESDFGFRALHSLEEGLRKTVEYCRSKKKRKRPH